MVRSVRTVSTGDIRRKRNEKYSMLYILLLCNVQCLILKEGELMLESIVLILFLFVVIPLLLIWGAISIGKWFLHDHEYKQIIDYNDKTVMFYCRTCGKIKRIRK